MKTNIIIALISLSTAVIAGVLFEFDIFPEIINHPYMKALIYMICLIGGWNLGSGISKYRKS